MKPNRRIAAIGGIVVLLAAVTAPRSDTELVLVDGRVLRGTEVRRDGNEYVLVLEGGNRISLPAALVQEVRLQDDETAEAPEPSPDPVSGLTPAKPRELGTTPPKDAPSGIRAAGPETLAGDPVRPPSKTEQLEALGAESEFQRDIVAPGWVPTTDWNLDPVEQNNFDPSTWAEDVVDPRWAPESAFDADRDAFQDSRSSWQKSIVDSTWKPQDGFTRR